MKGSATADLKHRPTVFYRTLCAVDPDDFLNLRAYADTDHVMITAREGRKVAAIDLTTDEARAFAARLIAAADLIDEFKLIDQHCKE